MEEATPDEGEAAVAEAIKAEKTPRKTHHLTQETLKERRSFNPKCRGNPKLCPMPQ